jgi:hypothetical protein
MLLLGRRVNGTRNSYEVLWLDGASEEEALDLIFFIWMIIT